MSTKNINPTKSNKLKNTILQRILKNLHCCNPLLVHALNNTSLRITTGRRKRVICGSMKTREDGVAMIKSYQNKVEKSLCEPEIFQKRKFVCINYLEDTWVDLDDALFEDNIIDHMFKLKSVLECIQIAC